MTDDWTELNFTKLPSFILSMSKMIANHDKDFSQKVEVLKKKSPLFRHILNQLKNNSHEEFINQTKPNRIFDLVICSTSNKIINGYYQESFPSEIYAKLNDFTRPFSHLTYDQNPRLKVLYLHLLKNNITFPEQFSKVVIPFVNPPETTTRIEEIDVYLYSIWLISKVIKENELNKWLKDEAALSFILNNTSSEFKSFFYSEMAKYLASINELGHFIEKRV